MAFKLPPIPVGVPPGHSYWNDWYEKLRGFINDIGSSVAWTIINFTGSNLTDIQTRNHNDLQTIQGGATGEYYHLTQDKYNEIASSVRVTSDYTTTSTSAVNIPGCSFTPEANKTYVVEGMFFLRTTDITKGMQLGVSYPSGITDGVHRIVGTNSTTTSAELNSNYTVGGVAASTGLPDTSNSYPAILHCTFVTGPTPSGDFNVTLQVEP